MLIAELGAHFGLKEPVEVSPLPSCSKWGQLKVRQGVAGPCLVPQPLWTRLQCLATLAVSFFV